MNRQSSAEDIQRLIVTCTGCLCLVILVMGSVYGVIKGSISVELLGSIQGLGVGGGLLGLGMIIYLILKLSFGGRKVK